MILKNVKHMTKMERLECRSKFYMKHQFSLFYLCEKIFSGQFLTLFQMIILFVCTYTIKLNLPESPYTLLKLPVNIFFILVRNLVFKVTTYNQGH